MREKALYPILILGAQLLGAYLAHRSRAREMNLEWFLSVLRASPLNSTAGQSEDVKIDRTPS
jgi:hypothetical protein